MITLEARQAGEALGLGELQAPVKRISIDSRTLQPGDLFVALRGECFDGHDYIEAAMAAGASGVVVQAKKWETSAARSGREMCPVYQVEDTLEALSALARKVRQSAGAVVFAITGSAGKTSTKDMLKAMVGRVREVVATSGNQNNQVGVPLTLLRLEAGTQAAIVEMGMRGIGQIAELTAVAEPDIGVITNVYPVHLELLHTLDRVAQAKAEVLLGLRPGGMGVVPADCGALEPYLSSCPCQLVRFGVDQACGGKGSGRDVVADVSGRLESSPDCRWRLALRWPGGETVISTECMPMHAVENAVAAVAACFAAGLPVAECARGLTDAVMSQGRGQVIEAGGVCVIDDSYNANPAAVGAAIEELARLASERGGRAVAVLGDMLELGPKAERYHEQAGEQAATAGVSVLWGVGPLSAATSRGFQGRWRERRDTDEVWAVRHVGRSEEAESVVEDLRAGDVVLVKGSRGVRLENVVIRVVDEGKAGRWSGGAADVDVDCDLTGETRHC